jgi:hypothetical protein
MVVPVTGSYLERSEVNDTVNVWMLREHIVKSFLIFDVELNKFWPLAAD